jgi:hypothetical protein
MSLEVSLRKYNTARPVSASTESPKRFSPVSSRSEYAKASGGLDKQLRPSSAPSTLSSRMVIDQMYRNPVSFRNTHPVNLKFRFTLHRNASVNKYAEPYSFWAIRHTYLHVFI